MKTLTGKLLKKFKSYLPLKSNPSNAVPWIKQSTATATSTPKSPKHSTHSSPRTWTHSPTNGWTTHGAVRKHSTFYYYASTNSTPGIGMQPWRHPRAWLSTSQSWGSRGYTHSWHWLVSTISARLSVVRHLLSWNMRQIIWWLKMRRRIKGNWHLSCLLSIRVRTQMWVRSSVRSVWGSCLTMLRHVR